MSYAVVTTKVDPKIKKEAMATAQSLGIPLSVVIKGFLREFIRTKTVTFSEWDEIPNERTRKILLQAEKDWKAGKGSPIFRTGEEAVAWLEKQGL